MREYAKKVIFGSVKTGQRRSKLATGEMSRSEVTREAYPIHFAIADAVGGTVEPFDQYQGPYIDTDQGRLFITVEEGGMATVWNEATHNESNAFFHDDENGAVEAALSVLPNKPKPRKRTRKQQDERLLGDIFKTPRDKKIRKTPEFSEGDKISLHDLGVEASLQPIWDKAIRAGMLEFSANRYSFTKNANVAAINYLKDTVVRINCTLNRRHVPKRASAHEAAVKEIAKVVAVSNRTLDKMGGLAKKAAKATHILYDAGPSGYTVRVMRGGDTIDEYNGGNSPHDSTGGIDRTDSDSIKYDQLLGYAEQTAKEMAQEFGLPESRVSHDEDLLAEEREEAWGLNEEDEQFISDLGPVQDEVNPEYGSSLRDALAEHDKIERAPSAFDAKFLKDLRIQSSKKTVYGSRMLWIFTPKGQVLEAPQGDIGHECFYPQRGVLKDRKTGLGRASWRKGLDPRGYADPEPDTKQIFLSPSPMAKDQIVPPEVQAFYKSKYPDYKVEVVKEWFPKFAASPKCPHCGSTKYALMPTDFETAKCEECGKNWDHGIVDGINNPTSKKSFFSPEDAERFRKENDGSNVLLNEREPRAADEVENRVSNERKWEPVFDKEAAVKTATVYPVVKEGGEWYIKGLPSRDWSASTDEQDVVKEVPDTFIIPGMNYSTANAVGLTAGLYSSLYDELQINDHLKEGDIFDTPVGQFICEGVHVIPYDEKAKASVATVNDAYRCANCGCDKGDHRVSYEDGGEDYYECKNHPDTCKQYVAKGKTAAALPPTPPPPAIVEQAPANVVKPALDFPLQVEAPVVRGEVKPALHEQLPEVKTPRVYVGDNTTGYKEI
jgi:ribosomal protein L37AE/L43A